MPLSHLLFRCPRCGHDPMEGVGDETTCPECGTAFRRSGSTGRIRIRDGAGEESAEAVPSELVRAIEAHGGALGSLEEREGKVEYEAPAILRRSQGEEAVRHAGRVLGFVERMGSGQRGILRLRGEVLSFHEGRTTTGTWSLLDLRAIQTSSSSLQVTGEDDSMVEFRFRGDSPRRWEGLLHGILRSAYRREGRGEIVEFQPRIVTEPETRR